jgi:hypothetical protein
MLPASQANILVLIPAYNEAGHIASVVGEARQQLPVLVVDDGSQDATAGLAQAAGATVVSQQPNAYQADACDLIIGERDFSKIPIVRRISNTIGRATFSWALGRPVSDNQSGYRLISRRLMEAMLASREQGFQFEVEMIVICVRQGFGLCGVPIRTIYAGESSHIQPLRHVLEFTRMLLRTRRAMR